MKRKYIIVLTLLSLSVKGQTSQVFSTQESTEKTDAQNRVTRINLFELEFGGGKLPISISYDHSGVKVNEVENSLGIGWNFDDLGRIVSITNYRPDFLTWSNPQVPDFSSNIASGSCSVCGDLNAVTNEDISPDLFTLHTITGMQYDFIYRRNINGQTFTAPTVEYLSNRDRFGMITNPFNFNNGCTAPDSSTVFEARDLSGNVHKFINGPVLQDTNRFYANGCRNNSFYVSSITNPNHTDFVNVSYVSSENGRSQYYAVGLNQHPLDPDYNQNVVNSRFQDYYFIDETRYNIETITTPTTTVHFVYSQNNSSLQEIQIFDLNEQPVGGYEFIYEFYESRRFLKRINMFNHDRTNSKLMYEFDYFPGTKFFSQDSAIDHFGYCNGVQKSNFIPFEVRLPDNQVVAAGDYEPNLVKARQYSLKTIYNNFGGTKEFAYTLNSDFNMEYGNLYGGGLLISSITSNPQIGKPTITSYGYQGLNGLTIQSDLLHLNYLFETGNKKFYTSIPVLNDINPTTPEPTLNSYQKTGNFFSEVTEYIMDGETYWQESKIIYNYVPNYEGIIRTPLLKKKSVYDGTNNLVKEIENTYNYSTLTTVNNADYRVETRQSSLQTHYAQIKLNRPIPVNVIHLTSAQEKTFNGSGTFTKNKSFTYSNAIFNRLRSFSETTSLGEVLETKMYYADDQEMMSEPLVDELYSQNNIGEPMKKELYKDGEKLGEEKIEFAQNSTTSNFLLKKHFYGKKGPDNIGALSRKMTLNMYDSNGNILEMTAENHPPVAFIWGYGNTKKIAVIENAAYSSISTSLIQALQTASNTGNETNFVAALKNLRTSLPNAKITGYIYKPLVGVSGIIDPKGDKTTYVYDDFGRLLYVKDNYGNIVNENTYNPN